jgi:type VI protein secretion system component VasK
MIKKKKKKKARFFNHALAGLREILFPRARVVRRPLLLDPRQNRLVLLCNALQLLLASVLV